MSLFPMQGSSGSQRPSLFTILTKARTTVTDGRIGHVNTARSSIHQDDRKSVQRKCGIQQDKSFGCHSTCTRVSQHDTSGFASYLLQPLSHANGSLCGQDVITFRGTTLAVCLCNSSFAAHQKVAECGLTLTRTRLHRCRYYCPFRHFAFV